ncbi:MAG TPA: hypothetical protein VFS43_00240 [Polyangiaceae bacterium]|nr:hypothetical protein [Polyangiaceae bacterium]
MNSKRQAAQRAAKATAALPRGAVMRADGSVVHRVSAYVDSDTAARLRAKAGDTTTVSEVAADVLRAHFRPRGASRARRAHRA